MEQHMASSRLTKKGYLRLRAEFDYLSQKERPKIVQGVAAAAAEGDRSENAEYIYGKKRLREIDKRLQYLARLLKNPSIIEASMVGVDSVGFGNRVTVADDEGHTKIWTIVGEGEADFKTRTISVEAPVARALLGKCIGDIAEVELEKGTSSFEIVSIAIGDID
jgi:transcription elongation factor GreB